MRSRVQSRGITFRYFPFTSIFAPDQTSESPGAASKVRSASGSSSKIALTHACSLRPFPGVFHLRRTIGTAVRGVREHPRFWLVAFRAVTIGAPYGMVRRVGSTPHPPRDY